MRSILNMAHNPRSEIRWQNDLLSVSVPWIAIANNTYRMEELTGTVSISRLMERQLIVDFIKADRETIWEEQKNSQ